MEAIDELWDEVRCRPPCLVLVAFESGRRCWASFNEATLAFEVPLAGVHPGDFRASRVCYSRKPVLAVGPDGPVWGPMLGTTISEPTNIIGWPGSTISVKLFVTCEGKRYSLTPEALVPLSKIL